VPGGDVGAGPGQRRTGRRHRRLEHGAGPGRREVERHRARHGGQRQRRIEREREHGLLGQVLDRGEHVVDSEPVGVLEHHRRYAVQRGRERLRTAHGQRAHDHRETVLGGEGRQPVGQHLLGLREVDQGDRAGTAPLDLHDRTLGEGRVDVGRRARAQHDIDRQHGVPGPGGGGQEVGDGAQRWFQPWSG